MLKKNVPAAYPAEALDQGVDSDVLMLLNIGTNGHMTSVGLLEATPPGVGFEEAALAAAQQFEFEPAEVDGHPMAVQIDHRFKFKPPPKAPPPAPAPPAPA